MEGKEENKTPRSEIIFTLMNKIKVAGLSCRVIVRVSGRWCIVPPSNMLCRLLGVTLTYIEMFSVKPTVSWVVHARQVQPLYGSGSVERVAFFII